MALPTIHTFARHRPLGPIGASLVAVQGAPPLTAIFEALQREVLDIAIEGPEIFEVAPDPKRSVVMLWTPSGLAIERYASVVAWAEAAEPRTGLLGCAVEGTSADSERALAAGFDDHVAGRCSPRELAARMRAVYRRLHWPAAQRSGPLHFGPLVLDSGNHEVWIQGRAVTLTGIELAVLRALIQAHGKTLSRTDLLDRAWGEGTLEISERAVDNVILRLRRKIDRPGLIRTVRGLGFRLEDC